MNLPFLPFSKSKGLAAVVAQASGVSIAALKASDADNPILEMCEYAATDEKHGTHELLREKVKQYKLNKRDCTTLMDLGEYSILSVEAPDVPHTELKSAIRWQIKDLIDFHIDDAVLDVFDAPASGSDGRSHNLYVVVSKFAAVRNKVSELQNVNANLATIDIPELVLRNITTHLPEDEAGVAFVYLTKDKGLLVLTRRSHLYLARTLDVGYDGLINNSVAEPEGLSLESHNAGFDRLVLEMQRSLDYYDRYFVQPPISGIVIAPTEQQINGLPIYMKEQLGIPARVLDLNEVVTSAETLTQHQQAHCLLAIGAAMRHEFTAL